MAPNPIKPIFSIFSLLPKIVTLQPFEKSLICHSHENGNPGIVVEKIWIPASAGMTALF
jgi:hypothetical protein